MTHVDCKSEVRLVIRSFLHPYPKKWVAIGHAVVYYARSGHRFSARIKCRHCTHGPRFPREGCEKITSDFTGVSRMFTPMPALSSIFNH